MPLYDYKCESCGKGFEVSHRMSETPKISCPDCSSDQVRKVLSTGGVMGTTTGGSTTDLPPSPCMGGGCAGGMCGL
ncbi:MAG: zinc ribbon domain-containing protein [Magnetococcales bacterium]|nr:zinc ribbon domain-containing protein [Magnetococcales bacterium]